MMKYIVANWKSHKTLDEARKWFSEFGGEYKQLPDVKVVVAVPGVYVFAAKKWLSEFGLDGVGLAVQDVSPFPFGAYTGAVAAGMLKGVVEHAIVGHSERREYFHETNQEVASKVRLLHEAGIAPILCVDEPYASSQIAALEEKDLSKLMVAYEPVEAIGSGTPEEPEQVLGQVAKIGKMAEGVPIIYGGSVKSNNAHVYLGVEGVGGLLVGGASLDARGFWGCVVSGLK